MTTIHIDVKQTIWERRTFNLDDEFYLIPDVDLSGKNYNECLNLLGINQDPTDYEMMYDSANDMSLSENNYNATIEVLNYNFETVLTNADSEKKNEYFPEPVKINKPQEFFDFLESIPTTQEGFTDEIRQKIIDEVGNLLNL